MTPTNRTDEVARRIAESLAIKYAPMVTQLQFDIASTITSAVEAERVRILKLLEEADPLMANSHG